VDNYNFKKIGGYTEFFKEDILNLDTEGKNHMTKLATISMSGGLDSTTLAYKAIEDGFNILPLNINYGQKNVIELKAFKEVVSNMKDQFGTRVLEPIYLDLNKIMSPIIESWQKQRDSGKILEKTGFEFYTPSRNLLFSVFAVHLGEVMANDKSLLSLAIGLGIHKHSDDIYSKGDYWDITPEFVERLDHLMELNDSTKVSMYAPYANSTKADIVKDAIRLKVPISSTWTCYDPVKTKVDKTIIKYTPCLECEACKERQQAGEEAGTKDINDYYIYLNEVGLICDKD